MTTAARLTIAAIICTAVALALGGCAPDRGWIVAKDVRPAYTTWDCVAHTTIGGTVDRNGMRTGGTRICTVNVPVHHPPQPRLLLAIDQTTPDGWRNVPWHEYNTAAVGDWYGEPLDDQGLR